MPMLSNFKGAFSEDLLTSVNHGPKSVGDNSFGCLVKVLSLTKVFLHCKFTIFLL